jgi:hypothetical protein
MSNAVTKQMTAAEAETCIASIGNHLNTALLEAKRLYDGQGWRALGYDSFAQCMRERLGVQKAQAYRLLQAAQVKVNLIDESPIGDSSIIPESQLRELAILETAEQQRTAYSLAVRLASDGKVTAKLLGAVARGLRAARFSSEVFVEAWCVSAYLEEIGWGTGSGQPLPEGEPSYWQPQRVLDDWAALRHRGRLPEEYPWTTLSSS